MARDSEREGWSKTPPVSPRRHPLAIQRGVADQPALRLALTLNADRRTAQRAQSQKPRAIAAARIAAATLVWREVDTSRGVASSGVTRGRPVLPTTGSSGSTSSSSQSEQARPGVLRTSRTGHRERRRRTQPLQEHDRHRDRRTATARGGHPHAVYGRQFVILDPTDRALREHSSTLGHVSSAWDTRQRRFPHVPRWYPLEVDESQSFAAASTGDLGARRRERR
jgi:hypothetical protein